ncbi:MAG: hypothetical protein ACO1QR_07485 [Chthoniobacteraceae bacterium]
MSPLPSSWKVPEIFRKRLGEVAGRQRAMSAEGHLLLVLHELPKPGDAERQPAFFWREPSGTWRATGTGSGLAELEAYQQAFAKQVDQMEATMDGEPSAERYFEILRISTPLLRTLRNAHRTLQEAREMVPDDRHILLARDQLGEQERSVELLHADAQHGLEYMIARQAEEQARNSEALVASGYRLNLLVAIFLPLTALGSAFGMNLVNGLEHIKSPVLFWLILIFGLVLGFLVKTIVTMPRRPALPPKRR